MYYIIYYTLCDIYIISEGLNRCSVNPVIMRFDGRVIPRELGDPLLERIYLISVCGIDFASRVHDHVDLTHYIKNWKDLDVTSSLS